MSLHHHVRRHYRVLARHAKDHFVPHKRNGHVPHVLKHRALARTSALIVLLKAIAVAAPIVLPSLGVFSSALTLQNIVDLTNRTRRDLGVAELRINARLVQAAQAKGEDMLAGQYFAHTSPSGTTPWTWLRRSGYQYRTAGENLAVHFTTAEDVQQSWLLSAAHRANIVDPRFSEIGVAVVPGTFEGFSSMMVVQLFGRPLNEPVADPPRVQATTTPPVHPVAVDTERASIVPRPGGFEVKLASADANPVKLVLGGSAATNGSEVPLSVVATDTQGTKTTQTIGWILPAGEARDVYHFTQRDNRPFSLLELITAQRLDAILGWVLMGIIAIVGSALVIALGHSRARRLSMAGHAAFVLTLAFFFTLF